MMMRPDRIGFWIGVVLLVAVISGPARAQGAPVYDIKARWGETHLPPGKEAQFSIQVRNVGEEDGKGTITIVDELPSGVKATNIAVPTILFGDLANKFSCSGTQTVECVIPEFFVSEVGFEKAGLARAPGTKETNGLLEPGIPSRAGLEPSGYLPTIFIDVIVAADASGTAINKASVFGGGATESVNDIDHVIFDEAPAGFGIVPASFLADVFDGAHPFGVPVRQAATHPFEQRVTFDLNTASAIGTDGTRYLTSHGLIDTAEVTLPRGMSGNPEATPKCNPVDFSEQGSTVNSTGCPANTQVGYLNVPITAGPTDYGMGGFNSANEAVAHIAIYNLAPPKGRVADFGFTAGGLVQGHIYPTPDPTQDYAIKTVTPNISSLVTVLGSEAVIWGVPGDPAHDKFRYFPEIQNDEGKSVAGASFSGAPIRPLLTTPSDCGFYNGGARIRLISYQHPNEFTALEEHADSLNVVGCGDPRFRFEPKLSMQPTSRSAGGPTGLNVHLEVPQRNDEVADAQELYAENNFVKGISTPPIKRVVVTLPMGMTISPSAAQGLGSCSSDQIGLGTDSAVRCPDNSQYGTLTLHTPLFPPDAQPKGFIYVAKQNDNPFRNFISLYLVVEEPQRGVLFKLPGRVDLDPLTGQITTTFDNIPQFPISDAELTLKGGIRAALVNPTLCGDKTITAEFFPWNDPGTPRTVKDSYEVTHKANGSPCVHSLAERPFAPLMKAGTLDSTAGSYSPFLFRLSRNDDDQEFTQVGLTLPRGVVAKFAGIDICSEAGILQASSRSVAGDGVAEQQDPSCPANSLIGHIRTGSGVGVPLTYVAGDVYLAGPYKGAPLSLVVITPAVIGPYDLGVIVVRSAISVNSSTAQGSAFTDPFPQIFQGIPVRIRDIQLELDRPRFTLNPTSCAGKSVLAHVTGTGGDLDLADDDSAADLVENFHAVDCALLGFRPRLSLRLSGGSHRGAHPRLKAHLAMPDHGANIARASVALPRSEFLDQGRIRTVCTRVQFSQQACPSGSVYGHALAKTPLFDKPLKGPVYLRSSDHTLPDLVAALRGPASQPVEIDLVGRIDSAKRGGIRTTFSVVPDAPVSTFTLTMKGGKKGLLVNSANLCTATRRATARFLAHNDKTLTVRPRLRIACKKGMREHHATPKGEEK